MRIFPIRKVVYVTLTCILLPASSSAQSCDLTTHGEGAGSCSVRDADSRLGGHAETIAANAALGALTGGIVRYVGGGSFWEGALGGAAGGTLSYIGKRIAIAEFSGSGFLGRQVNAVGASIVLNAASSRGLLDQLTLPVGPMRVDVRLKDALDVNPTLDVGALVATVAIAIQPGTSLDWKRSLSTGAPVFVDRKSTTWAGRHTAGALTIRHLTAFGGVDEMAMDYNVRHESIHLLQSDFTSIAWGKPFESWLLSHIPGGPAVHRYAALRSDLTLWVLMNAALEHSDRPTEREAYFLNQIPRSENVTLGPPW